MFKFLIVPLAVLMLVSAATVPRGSATGSSTNPPPNYGTFIVDKGTGAFPSTLDPANCYDPESGECIFNSMETVIFFLGEQCGMFMPMLATQVTVAPPDSAAPTFTNFTVYFKIRTGLPFQNRCRTDTPATWGNYYLTTADVQYSWQRLLVRDFVGAAAWLWYEPLLDCRASEPTNPNWGTYINDAVQKNNTHVWINCANPARAYGTPTSWTPVNMFLTDGGSFDPNFFGNCASLPLDYPLRILMQVISQPWCSITSKQWVLDYVNTQLPGIGGGLPAEWNGTTIDWASYTGWAADMSPFDKLPAAAGTPGVMCGTGPYVLDYYAAATGWSSVIYDKYYKPWPAHDFTPPYPSTDPSVMPSGIYPAGYVGRITVQQRSTAGSIADLINGAADTARIPRASAGQLHRNGDRNAETLEGIRLNYPTSTLQVESMHYTFQVDNPGNANAYGKIYPNDTLVADGIPANFLSNPHVRKAMTYLINYTNCIQNLMYGEAYQPHTCAPNGLPYVNTALPKYGPDPNIAGAKAELDQAVLGGVPLNTTGFTVPICYWEGASPVREASCLDLKAMIELVGTTYSLPYNASTHIIPWDFWPYYDPIALHLCAIFPAGWLSDYADIHNFLLGYADSQEFYASAQRFADPAIDADLAQAARTPDGSARQSLYYDAEQRLYEDNPTAFLYVPIVRGYQREWVQGMAVEYNALYPGVYARYVWKWLYMRGNVDYNQFCNMGDLNNILNAFGSSIREMRIQQRWNFHCDVDGNPKDSSPPGDGGWRDMKIDMYDISACLANLFRTEPAPTPWQPGLTGW